MSEVGTIFRVLEQPIQVIEEVLHKLPPLTTDHVLQTKKGDRRESNPVQGSSAQKCHSPLRYHYATAAIYVIV